MAKLGEKIKEHRIIKKISQTKLAKLVGCKRSNISNIEADRIYPSAPILIKIFKELDIKINLDEIEIKN